MCVLWLGLGSIGPAVELLVQPAEHTGFGGTQRLDPAIQQKLRAPALKRNLLGLFHNRSAAAQIENNVWPVATFNWTNDRQNLSTAAPVFVTNSPIP